jgi:ribonuclease P protein component
LAAREYAFGAKVRVSRSADYDHVFERPYRLGHAAFTLLARANGLDTARLGLVVSRRAVSRSVDRHRLKRLLRESFRLIRRQLPPCDILVLVKQPAKDLSSTQLYAAMAEKWRHLSLLCERSLSPR